MIFDYYSINVDNSLNYEKVPIVKVRKTNHNFLNIKVLGSILRIHNTNINELNGKHVADGRLLVEANRVVNSPAWILFDVRLL